jgi:hypothetical protein
LSVKEKNVRRALVIFGLIALSGCGAPDVEQMKAGLAKSGMPAPQAACFAEKMSKTVKGEPYNYIAKLMNAGMAEKEAVQKARRKFGADFKTGMEEARAACGK